MQSCPAAVERQRCQLVGRRGNEERSQCSRLHAQNAALFGIGLYDQRHFQWDTERVQHVLSRDGIVLSSNRCQKSVWFAMRLDRGKAGAGALLLLLSISASAEMYVWYDKYNMKHISTHPASCVDGRGNLRCEPGEHRPERRARHDPRPQAPDHRPADRAVAVMGYGRGEGGEDHGRERAADREVHAELGREACRRRLYCLHDEVTIFIGRVTNRSAGQTSRRSPHPV
jgi:hypothetical protein